jgi:thioesterase domain-containing protein
MEAANHRAEDAYRKRPLHCDVVLFKTRLVFPMHPIRYDGWKTLITGELQTRAIPGDHRQVFDEPFVRTLARELTECLDQRVPATIVGPQGDILRKQKPSTVSIVSVDL